VELLVKFYEISSQIKDALNYYLKSLDEITIKSNQSTLPQYIKSDIQHLFFITDHNLSIYQENCRQIENKLYNICEHNWSDDHIDGLNYECKKITYCEKCKLTKRECI